MTDLNAQGPIDASACRPLLEKLQGNILSGHGRPYVRYIFGRFLKEAGQDMRRALLRELGDQVTNAWVQRQDALEYRQTRVAKPHFFCNLFLSANGYRALDYKDKDIAEIAPEEPMRWVSAAFLDGMQKAAAEVGDPDPKTWGNYSEQIDFALLVAYHERDPLATEATRIMARCSSVAVTFVEEGNMLSDGSQSYEHFGFVDSVSQPAFFSEQVSGAHDQWNPAEPLGLVLVPDGGAKGEPDAYGSFFVFRKLEQNVRRFAELERQLQATLDPASDPERAAALAIGRFRDGTPVILDDDPRNANPPVNNFNYDGEGVARCPMHAHIRKANPRGDLTDQVGTRDPAHERPHRIVRRGIPYGPSPVRPTATTPSLDRLPTQNVGLLFGCFQANIARQFGHLQKRWLLNSDFVQGNTGKDPLLGSDGAMLQWPPTPGAPSTVSAPFGGCVTMKGGEFFFAPSVPFLRSL